MSKHHFLTYCHVQWHLQIPENAAPSVNDFEEYKQKGYAMHMQQTQLCGKCIKLGETRKSKLGKTLG